jgi:PTEN induced putative kinase 1
MMKKIFTGINQHGRRLLQKVCTRQVPQQVPRVAEPVAQRLTEKSSGFIARFVARNACTQVWAQELRNAARFRTHAGSFPIYGDYRAMGKRLSMYAFVAFGMASNAQGASTDSPRGMEEISSDVKHQMSQMLEKRSRWLPSDAKDWPSMSTEHFSFGEMIAKGCCGAVYEAKYNVSETESDIDVLSIVEEEHDIPESLASESDIEVINESEVESLAPQDFEVEQVDRERSPYPHVAESDIEILSEEEYDSPESLASASDIEVIGESEMETLSPLEFKTEEVDRNQLSNSHGSDDGRALMTYDLAVKMLFNYDTESIADVILLNMQNELIPANLPHMHAIMQSWPYWKKVKMKHLPPHPNIVLMEGAFVGDVPMLSGASHHFPHALPDRLYSDGEGRNKTLFIVMKRYPLTLRQYLQMHSLSLREAVLVFVQILEAVVHLQKHGFAHRDLKSDNFMVEFDSSGMPHVALIDFGCCLSSGPFGLRLHYSSDHVSKGGNAALMAPEISSAQPSLSTFLDFSRSDAWAAGAIAYEVFGSENPFYANKTRRKLDSRTFDDSCLPPLPEHVPSDIQNVVFSLLRRDPTKRLPAQCAANALHSWLWMPPTLTSKDSDPSDLLLRRWLLIFFASTCLRSSLLQNVETSLHMLYLSHFDSSFV